MPYRCHLDWNSGDLKIRASTLDAGTDPPPTQPIGTEPHHVGCKS